MNTSSPTQSQKGGQSPESGKGMVKEIGFATFSGSKFSPQFWQTHVFRPAYKKSVGSAEVQQWYARMQHAGRRESIGLATNNREEAARRAARLYRKVKAEGWDAALAEFSPDRSNAHGIPTVGEFIEAASKAIDVSPASLRNYVVCFRRIVSEAFHVRADASRFDYKHGGLEAWRQRVDRIRLNKVTPARVQAAMNARIAEKRGNPLEEQKARTTAASMLRQAKSLFSPHLKLPFEKVPNPFEGVRVKSSGPRKYRSTIDARQLLIDAKTELAAIQPEAYKAFLLALGAGLRKAEIDNLQWQQIDSAANTIRVCTTETFETKSEESDGEVFVDPGLIAELDAFRPKATSLYVLESILQPRPQSKIAFYRASETFDKLTKWLRSKGILTHKPIHTLRKEFGSLVCHSGDIHVASRQLRHASISLTSSYYVDNRKRIAPAIGDMLTAPKETQTVKGKE